MADQSDVSKALRDLISSIVYPDGLTPVLPSLTGPVPGTPVKIYAGWPDPKSLNDDLATVGDVEAKALHISIFPRAGDRNVTRYPAIWTEPVRNPVTYEMTVLGQAVTVSGDAPTKWYAQNLAVFVNGKPYVHTGQAGQDASAVAAALRALIAVDVPGTTVGGSIITLPAGARLGAVRVGTTATASKNVRQQQKLFQISIWTDSDANRVALVQAIDPVMADTPWLDLADGSKARLIYHAATDVDADQRQGIFRRDLLYLVEFATVRTDTFTEIVVQQTDLLDTDGDLIRSTVS